MPTQRIHSARTRTHNGLTPTEPSRAARTRAGGPMPTQRIHSARTRTHNGLMPTSGQGV